MNHPRTPEPYPYGLGLRLFRSAAFPLSLSTNVVRLPNIINYLNWPVRFCPVHVVPCQPTSYSTRPQGIMVNSNAVPSSYTLQWNASVATSASGSSANAPQGALPNTSDSNEPPSTSRGQGTARARYNTSCNNCRRSRVRCSGGSPCQRCASLHDASGCVYRLSQRHGKRKASINYDMDSDSPSPQLPASVPDTPRTSISSSAPPGGHMQVDFGDIGQLGSFNPLSIPSSEIFSDGPIYPSMVCTESLLSQTEHPD